MTDQKQEIRNRLTDPATVLDKLGLLESAKKSRNGYMIPCLWHGENDPSCSVREHPQDGTLSVFCFGCSQGADIFGLIAQVYGLSPNNQFSDIINIAAGMAGVTLDESPGDWAPPPKRMAPPPPEYPPVDDLRAMWTECLPPSEDPQARDFFGKRNLSTERLAGLCRVIPRDYDLPPWAIYKDDESGRYDWLMSGHRLIFPLYNFEGKIRSFKARGMLEGKIKNVNPLGYSTAGLCFACNNGQDMLSTGKHFDSVLFAEGEVDFLSAVELRQDADTAVFGIYSGGWSDEHSSRLKCDNWYFSTDIDDPGDNYHYKIRDQIIKFYKSTRKQ